MLYGHAARHRHDLKQSRTHHVATVDECVPGSERTGERFRGEVLGHVRVGDAVAQVSADLDVVALGYLAEHRGLVLWGGHRSCNAPHAQEVPAKLN
jgi:hypothetical protein